MIIIKLLLKLNFWNTRMYHVTSHLVAIKITINYPLKINSKTHNFSLLLFPWISMTIASLRLRAFQKDCLSANGDQRSFRRPIQPQLVTRHNNNFGREIGGRHVHEITGGRHSLHKSLNAAADIWSPALGEYPFPPKWPRERLNFTRITPWNTLRDLAAQWRAANSSRFNIESCISVIVSLQIGIRGVEDFATIANGNLNWPFLINNIYIYIIMETRENRKSEYYKYII